MHIDNKYLDNPQTAIEEIAYQIKKQREMTKAQKFFGMVYTFALLIPIMLVFNFLFGIFYFNGNDVLVMTYAVISTVVAYLCIIGSIVLMKVMLDGNEYNDQKYDWYISFISDMKVEERSRKGAYKAEDIRWFRNNPIPWRYWAVRSIKFYPMMFGIWTFVSLVAYHNGTMLDIGEIITFILCNSVLTMVLVYGITVCMVVIAKFYYSRPDYDWVDE